ncbi:MAG: histidine ammonia-lyase, partial [Acidimicrobiia bacterium]|nr:histidine ammonia-lyase [Acidimicrobiia bacterium]
AMMLLRARSLAMGFSGARPLVAQAIVDLLNAGITPVVREHGSLGASGDLAPLAAAALPLIGEGSVRNADGTLEDALSAIRNAGLEPIELRAKEGLALINGTDGMLGMLVLALEDLGQLAKVSDIAGAMTTEALLGTDRAFAHDLIAMRPQVGQAESADNLRSLLNESPVIASHRHGDDRVQDPYSIRCTPQVHGAVRDAASYAAAITDRELVSFIDNPVVLPDGRVESCGNFHGAPLAHAADFLAIAVGDLGALCERRTDRMLDPKRSYGLPPFLTEDAGVNSGYMIAHYTQAAMVAENRRLAAPASVDTIPTSAMQEDHVSMGWAACRKLRLALDNLRRILAIEIVCATRAFEFRAPLAPAKPTGSVAQRVHEIIGESGQDVWLSPLLERVAGEIRSGHIVAAAESESGVLL